jgi:hypothetical protein
MAAVLTSGMFVRLLIKHRDPSAFHWSAGLPYPYARHQGLWTHTRVKITRIWNRQEDGLKAPENHLPNQAILHAIAPQINSSQGILF